MPTPRFGDSTGIRFSSTTAAGAQDFRSAQCQSGVSQTGNERGALICLDR